MFKENIVQNGCCDATKDKMKFGHVAYINWIYYRIAEFLHVDSQSDATWKRTHNTLRSPPEPPQPNLSLGYPEP